MWIFSKNKSFVLQSLTTEAAVHKKTSISKESNKDDNKTKIKIEQVYMNATRYIVSSSLSLQNCLILALNDSSIGFLLIGNSTFLVTQ